MSVFETDQDGWEAVPVAPTTQQELEAVVLATDTDGKAECPGCGGRYNVTAKGTITGQHKCPGVRDVDSGGKPKTTRAVIKGKKAKTPEKVRQVAGDLIAAGMEWTAAESIARAVPMPKEAIPAEVVTIDSDTMVGPFLDLLWPQLPPKAQRVVSRIADEGDLIAAVFAWMEWQRGVSSYTREARRVIAGEPAPHLASVSPMFTPPTNEAVPEYVAPEGNADEPSGQDAEQSHPVYGEPFRPA